MGGIREAALQCDVGNPPITVAKQSSGMGQSVARAKRWTVTPYSRCQHRWRGSNRDRDRFHTRLRRIIFPLHNARQGARSKVDRLRRNCDPRGFPSLGRFSEHDRCLGEARLVGTPHPQGHGRKLVSSSPRCLGGLKRAVGSITARILLVATSAAADTSQFGLFLGTFSLTKDPKLTFSVCSGVNAPITAKPFRARWYCGSQSRRAAPLALRILSRRLGRSRPRTLPRQEPSPAKSFEQT
jgi:hypothetical protein